MSCAHETMPTRRNQESSSPPWLGGIAAMVDVALDAMGEVLADVAGLRREYDVARLRPKAFDVEGRGGCGIFARRTQARGLGPHTSGLRAAHTPPP